MQKGSDHAENGKDYDKRDGDSASRRRTRGSLSIPRRPHAVILQIPASPRSDRGRINRLAANCLGKLTPKEAIQLENYIRVGQTLGILRSKARRSSRASTHPRSGASMSILNPSPLGSTAGGNRAVRHIQLRRVPSPDAVGSLLHSLCQGEGAPATPPARTPLTPRPQSRPKSRQPIPSSAKPPDSTVPPNSPTQIRSNPWSRIRLPIDPPLLVSFRFSGASGKPG